MSNESDYFLSKDGHRLHYYYWSGESPTHLLCIVHGLGDHGMRYRHVGEYLSGHGIAVFAMDLRGHGQSEGKKGHTPSYDLLLSDIEELLKTARAEHTDLPMYLMGHSMGGNIVANYLIEMSTNELAGFILSAPWFRLAFEPPAWRVKAARILTGILPSLTQPNQLNTSHLSRDPAVVKAYEEDPLVHDRLSAGLFAKVMEAAQNVLKRVSEIELPGLIYHGDQDQIISFKATQEFAEKCPNAEWHALDGVYHEPHNDLGKEQLLELILNWLKKEKA